MKKKNIALAMAAVTVASTVAPAFANNKEESKVNEKKFVVSPEKSNEVVSEVEKLLAEKFADNTAVYTVLVSYNETKDGVTSQQNKEITDIKELKEIMFNEDNTNIVLKITDKGHYKDKDNVNQGEFLPTYDNKDQLMELTTILDNTKGIDASFEPKGSKVVVKVGRRHSSTDTKTDIAKQDFKNVLKVMEINVGEAKLAFEPQELKTLIKVNYNNGSAIEELELSEALNKVNEEVINIFDKIYKFGKFDSSNPAVDKVQKLENEFLAILSDLANLNSKVDFRDNKLELTDSELEKIEAIIGTKGGSDNNLANLIEEMKAILGKINLEDNSGVLTQDEADELNGKLDEIYTLVGIKNFNNTDHKYDILPLEYLIATKEFDRIEDFTREKVQDVIGATYEVVLADYQEETVTSEALFDGTTLTDEGKELINVLENGIKIDDKVFEIQADGDYTINPTEDGNYELVMNFVGKSKIKSPNTTDEIRFQVKVTAQDKESLEKVKEIFTIITPGQVAGYKVDSIIGARRTETALKISKENFKSVERDGSVVLVGADAVVDGLAAGPLARLLDAPVLLTNKDSLDENVKEEIERLLVNDTITSELKTQTVYIVGGEAVVSENVVDQLKSLGIKVERLAGDSRDTTSLAVAEKMEEKGAKFEQAFVVGATGEADAMSIAAHAAKEEAPIIVSALDGTLSKDAKFLMKKKQIDIIGGETVVSKELEAELKDIDKDKKVVRVKGSNRAETNANVINRYYNGVKQVYVAKDGKIEGNDKLVDALAISPVAAKNGGVVVLATNDLTEAQQEALELKASNATKLTQVGGGVTKTVVEKIAALLKL